MGDTITAIYQAVLDGRVEDAIGGVKAGITSGSPVRDLLNLGLITAMDEVGRRFGEGEIFIPQVLWSAKAMQAAVDVLKPHFPQEERIARGLIIIGTARGDIHDIGKNLVAMMLEGAGFEVLDLGVDVAPERFVETALKEKADIIALSALLTTTMPGMGEVVDLLKERGLFHTKVLIGGAPVDESFKDEIGADAYGIDAVDAVKKVKALLGLVELQQQD